jgi:uncharacterized protein
MKTLLMFLCLGAAAPAAEPALNWMPWSEGVFAQAKAENKFVLLDLEAVWCHWCHVMDQTTYRDPATVALLNSKYLLVRVDQDSRPDLSNRYEDYGWPATVVFNADGQEIVKRRGYLPPPMMASMLQAIIDDPTPGPSVIPESRVEFAESPFLSAELRLELRKKYVAGYDAKYGSWGTNQKYLDWDSVEYAMSLARHGDVQAERMARQTLDAQLNLLDPAWGGVYQYSTDGDWKHPHFEKIMQMQAENLRIYSLAYAQFRKPEYLRAASEIHRYLKTFLMSPEGAFYTSQDADLIDGEHSASFFKLDDAGRRKLGVPRVDKHMYARENGWAIHALTAFFQATGDVSVREEATRAAEWVIANRGFVSKDGADGGFRHGSLEKATDKALDTAAEGKAVDTGADVSGPYLGDTLAMTRAFLSLYTSTGDRVWLSRAQQSLHFIAGHFTNADGAGFLTAAVPTDHAYKPHPERDENLALARVANLAFHYTGDAALQEISRDAMRFPVTPEIAREYGAGGTLLADSELTSPPIHLTIVGHKDAAESHELFAAALQFPSGYKRVEWWDKREGALANADVEYPELSKPAAFVCTDRSCSSPIFDPAKVLMKAAALSR